MIALIGAGGHAKVVIDAWLASGRSLSELSLRDGNIAAEGKSLMGIVIAVPELPDNIVDARIHLALGDCAARSRLLSAAREGGALLETILHSRATIAATARLEPGCFVAAGAIIAPFAGLGASVIVNHNAVIDHDSLVGECSHIAPGATLGGGAQVGAGVLIGAGAVVLPGRKVGERAVIGAGAVVTRDVPADETWLGLPAKRGCEMK